MNSRQKLAIKIMDWSKGGNPSYALGSSWFTNHEVTTEVVYNTILEYERILSEPGTLTLKEIRELKTLINRIIKAAGCVLVLDAIDAAMESRLVGVFQTNDELETAMKADKAAVNGRSYEKHLAKIGESYGIKDSFNWLLV